MPLLRFLGESFALPAEFTMNNITVWQLTVITLHMSQGVVISKHRWLFKALCLLFINVDFDVIRQTTLELL